MSNQKKCIRQRPSNLVMHRKKGLTGPLAQKTSKGCVKSVGQYRDQNGPAPA